MAGPVWALAAAAADGVHRPGDEYRIALYGPGASLGPLTERYTPEGEVVGEGYFEGGLTLSGRRIVRDRDVAILTFDDAAWPLSTISAAGALLYNATRGGAAVAVFALPEDRDSVEGPFTVRMPPATRDEGLVRFVAVP